VLAALGIYASAAGPVGEGVAALVGALLGRLAAAVPLALVAGGVALLRGPRHDAELDLTVDDPDATAVVELPEGSVAGSSLRRGVGAALGVVVIAGVLDVFGGEGLSVEADGLDAFAGAGGLLGAGVAGGLAALVGRWGALAVLVGLAVLAVSLVSGRSLRRLGGDVGTAASPLVQRGGRWVAGLFRIDHTVEGAEPGPDAVGDATAAGPVLFDQDADAAAGDGDPDAPRSPRKRRRP
jgi:S-DNA-T family DNA segregation ATPase FtsK/SpoIIIE